MKLGGRRRMGVASARLALASLAWVSVGLAGCYGADDGVEPDSGEPEAHIMSTLHALSEPAAIGAGHTCTNLAFARGSSSSGDVTNSLWTRESSDGGGLSVQIGSFEQLLEQRHYGRDFSESRSVDQFVVTAADGARYEFIYWGGGECEPCPPPPYQAPEDDPLGCASSGLEPPPSAGLR